MNIQSLLERAGLLLEQGRHKDAETHIREALRLEPGNGTALSLMARFHFDSKQFDEGIAAIQNAISVDSQNSFYFYLLAFGYYQKDQLTQAVTNLEKAISLNPYVAEYFGMLAFVLLREKNFEAALARADEGLALDPTHVTCLNARATALNKLRRTDDAFETMNSALAEDPENELTHTTIGWNLLERGRNRDAERHFMEALRIDPNHASAKSGLKEALKSRILPYKWLLQYSFWISNKGRNFQVALPIILYISFRVLIGLSRGSGSTAVLGWILGGIYILMVVVSWTIGSIANFVLLFNRTGKYALTHTERWSAITVVSALVAGIAILLVATLGTADSASPYTPYLFGAGLVCVSLALPLGNIEYPLSFANKGWRDRYALLLVALGLVSLACFALAPALSLFLLVAYGIAFLVYNWSGIAGR
ncbi:MAG TPA: tetratricopeptide repeat protein [Flavisolibacter sp.]|nr:tetratricopeptide repeat protein [Flavisolibacter sp.]